MIFIEPKIYQEKKSFRTRNGETIETSVEDIYYERVSDIYPEELLSYLQLFLKCMFEGNIFDGLTKEECFKKLILLSPQDMVKLISNYKGDITALPEWVRIFENNKEGTNKKEKIIKKSKVVQSIYEVKKVYTMNNGIMSRGAKKSSILQQMNQFLIDNIGLKVCPYCNRNYISNRGQYFSAQMDHFYNKSKFPFFAISLYNLIPSCSSCNLIKSDKDFELHPFVDYKGKHDVVFTYILVEKSVVKVEIKTTNQRRDDIEKINLEDTYQIHSSEIENMLEREEEYIKEYRDELRSVFNIQFSDDEIDRMIFGDSVFEEDIKNISLGKFKKDIYQEIKSLRDY